MEDITLKVLGRTGGEVKSREQNIYCNYFQSVAKRKKISKEARTVFRSERNLSCQIIIKKEKPQLNMVKTFF